MHSGDHGGHGAHQPGDGERGDGPEHEGTTGAQSLPGLASSDGGLRFDAEPIILRAGREVAFEFQIVRDPDHRVTAFDELHERRMHLIVLRRDLTGFQHLHPEMDEAGTWRTRLSLPSGGAWRAFADFSAEGKPTTLGVDVLVEGEFKPEPLPEASTTAHVDDHLVSLHQDDAGRLLRFAVTRGGERVDVQPYLGAKGHLVAVRWGDLAFLHVHPVGQEFAFSVEYPTVGQYRVFLQYLADGAVRTAAFTIAAGLLRR